MLGHPPIYLERLEYYEPSIVLHASSAVSEISQQVATTPDAPTHAGIPATGSMQNPAVTPVPTRHEPFVTTGQTA